MAEKGWSANAAEVLRFRVVRALAAGESDTRRIAEALEAEPRDVALVIDQLTQEGLADGDEGTLASTFTDAGWLLAAGERYASEVTTTAASPAKQRRAAKAALLDWLSDVAGESITSTDDLLVDERGSFFGEPFCADVLRDAARSLLDAGLVSGTGTWDGTVLRPEITTVGEMVSSHFAGDVVAWEAAKAQGGTTINANNSTGVNVAANSPGSQQASTVLIGSGHHDQIIVVADALDQMLPILRLTPQQEKRAVEVAGELRAVAESSRADSSQLRGLLNDAREFGIGAAAGAAGTGLVAIVETASRALGF